MVLPGNVLQRAVILDFRGSIWESLHGLPGNSLFAAAILDFRGSTWESLQHNRRRRWRMARMQRP